MTDEHQEAYNHTRERLMERHAYELTPEGYDDLMCQIRNGAIKTSITRFKGTTIHLVQTSQGRCVVAYRNGLIRTAYPSSFPIPKRALDAFERTYKKVKQDA